MYFGLTISSGARIVVLAIGCIDAADALGELHRRPWYGNVRELRNAVEHAVIVARSGSIEPEHLPPPVLPVWPAASLAGRTLEDRLAELIRQWAEQQLAQPAADEGQFYDDLLCLIEPPLLETVLQRHRGHARRRPDARLAPHHAEEEIGPVRGRVRRRVGRMSQPEW